MLFTQGISSGFHLVRCGLKGWASEVSNCRTNLNLPLSHCPAYMHSAFCTLPSLCVFCTKEYAACTLPSLFAFCTPCTFYTLPSLCNAFCTTEYAAHTQCSHIALPSHTFCTLPSLCNEFCTKEYGALKNSPRREC